MKTIKLIGIILVSAFVILQFFPVELPETTTDNPNDLLQNNKIPEDINTLLVNGCYDCHSNATKYPWYSHVKPTAWLVARDTKVGREHLNLSDWESLSLRKKIKVLNEISESVESHEMPFKPYKITHKGARYTQEERQKIIKWTADFSESLMN